MNLTRVASFYAAASKLRFETHASIGKDKSLMAHDQYTEAKTIWIQLR